MLHWCIPLRITNDWKYPECLSAEISGVDSRNIWRFSFQGIFELIWKQPEHPAGQAISALISDYQYMVFGGKAQHYLLSSSGPTTPVRTQPNWVRSAAGYPGGPRHQPWSITQLNMSAPNTMSTLSGTPNCWSASCNPCRCFHLPLKGTGEVDNSVMTLASTAASTFH